MITNGTLVDDKFVIRRVVGVGGQGQVYDAEQLHFERRVALKILKANFSDQEAHARFLREAQILSNIKHRSLPLFFGYGMWDGRPYMALEWIDGESLTRSVAAAPLSVRQSLEVMCQLADVLTRTHAHGVIHRDLKPDNIMLVKEDGEVVVKLLDFGLSGFVAGHSGGQQLTVDGTAIGTVTYMSPEQCTGGKAIVASDIYSLGCILYFCLTGMAPFQAETQISIMLLHVNEPFPKLYSRDGVPSRVLSELNLLLSKCVAKVPTERYSTCDDLLCDLQKLLKLELQQVAPTLVEGDSCGQLSEPFKLAAPRTTNPDHERFWWKREINPRYLIALVLFAAGFFGCLFVQSDAYVGLADSLFRATQGLVSQRYARTYTDFFLSIAKRNPGTASEALLEHLYSWSRRTPVQSLSIQTDTAVELMRQRHIAGEDDLADRLCRDFDSVFWDDAESREPGGATPEHASELTEALWRVHKEHAIANKVDSQALFLMMVKMIINAGHSPDSWASRLRHDVLMREIDVRTISAARALQQHSYAAAVIDARLAVALARLPRYYPAHSIVELIYGQLSSSANDIAPLRPADKESCQQMVRSLEQYCARLPDTETKADELFKLVELNLALKLDGSQPICDRLIDCLVNAGLIENQKWLSVLDSLECTIFTQEISHQPVVPRQLLSKWLSTSPALSRLAARRRLLWCEAQDKAAALSAIADVESAVKECGSKGQTYATYLVLCYFLTQYDTSKALPWVDKYLANASNALHRSYAQWMLARYYYYDHNISRADVAMIEALKVIGAHPERCEIMAAFFSDAERIFTDAHDAEGLSLLRHTRATLAYEPK